MNRTLQATVGVILILIITFAAISVTQQIGRNAKIDVTDQKIFTLSEGTQAILGQLNQPIKAKLYFGKTAALDGPEQIRFFMNYYEFVRSLLEEYVQVSKGMVELEIVDPRPFSQEEEEAIQYGLRRVPLTQEENFFFGLVVQTQFGVAKTIPFFTPDRQNFVEYDISYLIDTAITRTKKTLGIMSSLPVMGDSGYMAYMMQQQGQQPKPAWGIVEQLKNQYDVKEVATDINDVSDLNDVDVLLVIHPKDLSEQTQFAIDQYVLRGGRTIMCVDPYCWSDRPQQPMNPQQPQMADQGSNLETLLNAWGLEMPNNTFAGDRRLAIETPLSNNARAQKVIGFLDLTTSECFNKDINVSAQLNNVRVLFAGVLKETASASDPNAAGGLKRSPIIQTTVAGNSFKINGPYEIQYGMADLMKKFTAVTMGMLLTGNFKSAFPKGIVVDVTKTDPNDPNETLTVSQRKTGLATSSESGAVIVFSDVDFISDMLAYQNSFLGRMVVGDNSTLLINAVENLGGSSNLISIRSRGNYRRPFEVVDRIEAEADKETAEEMATLQAQIDGYNKNLQALVASSQGEQEDVIGSTILKQRRDIELQIHQAKRQLNDVKLKRRERIEALESRLRQLNMLAVPAVILVVAIALGLHRSVRKRHYISSQR